MKGSGLKSRTDKEKKKQKEKERGERFLTG